MGLIGGLAKKETKPEGSAEKGGGKYNESCSLCGKSGTEKKWLGQYWHKKCLRKSKKFAKGMI